PSHPDGPNRGGAVQNLKDALLITETREGLTLYVEAGRKTSGQLFRLFPVACAGISAHKRGIDSGAIGGKCSIPLNHFAPPPRTHECAGEAQVLGTTCRWDGEIVWRQCFAKTGSFLVPA